MSETRLAETLPLPVRDPLIEKLHAARYLVTTDQGRVLLCRDLRRATLADLARDLDLSLGRAESGAPGLPDLAPILARLAEA